MNRNSRIFGQKGALVVWGILGAFTLSGIALMAIQLRQDLRLVTVHNTKHASVQRAWYGIEKFFKDSKSCSSFLQGRKLGDTVVSIDTFGPTIGQEWLNTGQIVQDLYLLRREDEVAWQVSSRGQAQAQWDPTTGEGVIYVKVSLVTRPAKGVSMGVDHLISAPKESRIFPVKVMMAQEQTFTDCDPVRAQEACQQAAFEMGAVAQMRPSRAPASISNTCVEGPAHSTQCLLPGDRFPIYKCQ